MEKSNESIEIRCKEDIKSPSGTVLFHKKDVYTAEVFGSSLLVKDETGCIRTVSTSKTGEWHSDKFFKQHFEVVQ